MIMAQDIAYLAPLLPVLGDVETLIMQGSSRVTAIKCPLSAGEKHSRYDPGGDDNGRRKHQSENTCEPSYLDGGYSVAEEQNRVHHDLGFGLY
jgi:hypothetical protein